MRSNGAPAIKASALPPNTISMSDRGGRTLVKCRACGAWRSLKRKMITHHRGPHVPGADAWPAEFRPPAPWCPGGGQKIVMDLTHEEWAASLAVASCDAERRRGTRPVKRPTEAAALAAIARSEAEARTAVKPAPARSRSRRLAAIT
ncbi:hypothetical protein ACQP1W_36865 [Spirillospora sp. CA-255316]